MIEAIKWVLFIAIVFVPIAFWGYLFTYYDNSELNRKRFFSGILAWAISVLPILYLEQIIDSTQIKALNIFAAIYNINDIWSTFWLFTSLNAFLIISALWTIFIGLFFFWRCIKQTYKLYFKNLVWFLTFALLASIVVFIVSKFFDLAPSFNLSIPWTPVAFKDMVFNSLKLVLFYYLLVWLIEEASKHFNFLQSSLTSINNVKEWVLYSIYIALWFAFVENIVYLVEVYKTTGIWTEAVTTFIFRSIFSVMVHVTCSTIVSYYFCLGLIKYRHEQTSLKFIKYFVYWISISVLAHAIYDIFLTLGFTLIIFIYFIGGYLYVTRIFFDKRRARLYELQ